MIWKYFKIVAFSSPGIPHLNHDNFLECQRVLTVLPIQTYCYCLAAKSCPTLLQPHGRQPTRLLCPWDFPGKNIGVDCHFPLQGIFPKQGSSPHLLHCRHSLPLSHHRNPSPWFNQFSHSVVSNSLQPHGSQHARPLCPSPTPRVYPNPCPSSR